MTFVEKLNLITAKNNSLLCVGLDAPPKRQFDFNKAIIDVTADLVCAFKPNSAFYEARGWEGVRELKQTCDYIRDHYLDIPIILDAKRGDIGTTNEGYVTFAFDYLGTDAITLHPYLGKETLAPFLKRKDKGCIILCRTSNPGAGEFQDLPCGGKPLYQVVAEKVSSAWNENGNCALVVGATYPEELNIVRHIVGDMPLLVPGVGAQGGDLASAVRGGLDSHGSGMIISASRSVIFAKNPRDAAEKLRNEINTFRGKI